MSILLEQFYSESIPRSPWLLYYVSLGYRDQQGAEHNLAVRHVWAQTVMAATKAMMDKFWDDRLDAAGCHPIVQFLAVPCFTPGGSSTGQ